MEVLRPQLPADNSVEIIIKENLPYSDGGPTIGTNRNEAVADASGEYVCFVDDDDMVAANYVELILKAIKPTETSGDFNAWRVRRDGADGCRRVNLLDDGNTWEEMFGMTPDVIGIKGHYLQGGNKPELFVHSLEYKDWKTVDGVHQRCPNQLNPVKRELALQVPYPEKNHGEDMDYALALLPLLKTEVMIDEILYFYIKE